MITRKTEIQELEKELTAAMEDGSRVTVETEEPKASGKNAEKAEG